MKTPRALRRDELRKFKNICVVFGSRKFRDYDLFVDCLIGFMDDFSLTKENTAFVSGMASDGPDNFIVRWCRENDASWHEMPAAWDDIDAPGAVIKTNKHGKKYNALAGFTRNQDMVHVCSHGLGFWDGSSPGTKDMTERCNAKESLFMRLVRTAESTDG